MSTKVNIPKTRKVDDKLFVKFFEKEQRDYGTKIALGNLFWLIGADFMEAAGVRNIKTTYTKGKSSV